MRKIQGRKIKGDAYRNLHFAERTYSFKSKGVVILHSPCLLISDAEFFVNESGRQRVLRDKKKNVHAGVRGSLVVNPFETEKMLIKIKENGVKAYYNPYKLDSFVDVEGKPLLGAEFVFLSDNAESPVLIYNPVYKLADSVRLIA